MAEWRTQNVGVFPDVVGDDMALKLGLKIKSLCGHENGKNAVHLAYFPHYSQTEFGVMTCGHHTLHDGISLFQCVYTMTD